MNAFQTAVLIRGLREIAKGFSMTDKKAANPFEEIAANTPIQVNPPVDKAIEKYASFLGETAQQLQQSKTPLARLMDDDSSVDYLMDKIDGLLDQETWSADDCCNLASMFFLLASVTE